MKTAWRCAGQHWKQNGAQHHLRGLPRRDKNVLHGKGEGEILLAAITSNAGHMTATMGNKLAYIARTLRINCNSFDSVRQDKDQKDA